MKTYRDNGAIGALLDEYERAILELQKVISKLSQEQLITIVDHKTKDADCKSIQTILTHVISSGYYYAIAIREAEGEQIDIPKQKISKSIKDYQVALDKMFQYNEKLFEDYPNLKIEEKDSQKKILVSWGQVYDPEQLLEHAIVHILRHRRQIERFLIKLNE